MQALVCQLDEDNAAAQQSPAVAPLHPFQQPSGRESISIIISGSTARCRLDLLLRPAGRPPAQPPAEDPGAPHKPAGAAELRRPRRWRRQRQRLALLLFLDSARPLSRHRCCSSSSSSSSSSSGSRGVRRRPRGAAAAEEAEGSGPSSAAAAGEQVGRRAGSPVVGPARGRTPRPQLLHCEDGGEKRGERESVCV